MLAGLSAMNSDVLVGVPAEKAQRKEENQPMNNATLAYIHDNGSPAANIPARPFMRPGIYAAQDKITGALRAGAVQALDGKTAAVERSLNIAGLTAQSSIRGVINEGIAPPLADSTLEARARRGSKSAKHELNARSQGMTLGNAGAKPLIDTGQLRNSINYVVRRK